MAQKSKPGSRVSFFLLSADPDADLSAISPPHVCLHAAMLPALGENGLNLRTVSPPQVKAFFFKSCCAWPLFTAIEQTNTAPNSQSLVLENVFLSSSSLFTRMGLESRLHACWVSAPAQLILGI